MESKLRAANPNIKSVEDFPKLGAYVIFEMVSDKAACLKDLMRLARCDCGLCAKRYPQEKKLLGKYKLRAQVASEPSKVLWENLEVRPCESCCRTTIVIILMLIAMAVSFSGIYLIRVYQNSLPTLENCEQYASVTLDQLASTASDEEAQCVCSREGYWSLLTDSQIKDKC